MRKIIVSVEVSLDAVEENPQNFVFDSPDKGNEQYAHDLLFGADALIMGRETYEGLAEAWLGMAGQDDFADRMNSMPKYVASDTLQEPLRWNASLLQGDLNQTLTELKEQEGNYLLQYGIGSFTMTLLEYGLVDEIRVIIYPVVMGEGQRIFEKLDKTALTLLESKIFDSGVVALHYAPAPPKQTEAEQA